MTDLNKKIITIKRWDNGDTIHSGEYASIADCFNAANKEGKSFFKADLNRANLRSANLSFADLRSANLSFADLRSANLNRANLRSANLSFADLRSANLSFADLRFANLHSANLHSADLRSANLRFANLSSAGLSFANLRSADLSFARNVDDVSPFNGVSFNGVIGDGVAINSMQFGEYRISIIGDICSAGCTTKTCEEWLEFSGDDLDDSDKAYLNGITKPYIIMVLAMRELELVK